MKNLDFLAIGDITTDAFIRLEEAGAHCDIDRGNLELCMNFGDKIPYEFVEEVPAVGNSPNAAVSAARLGLQSALITNLGDDENGKKCLDSLKKDNVDVSLIKIHAGFKSNYHYVLWFEDDRTILVKHEKYERRLPDFGEPKWVYLSSIGGGTEKYHEEIADYLEKHPAIKLALQPGTFQINLGKDKLKKIYQKTEVLALNKKEAGQVLGEKKENEEELLKNLSKLGPKNVLMTDGVKGAYFYDGKEIIFAPPYPDPKPPYERTGAGDAYASTFISALILGKTAKEALRWAAINSMSVVQQIGAQKGLLSRKEIEKYLAEAPADYLSKK
jgi:sugar/nucleoside kinase (ribokinase family)